MTEQDWYRDHNCSHAHCPDGCEHPQPFLADDGRMLCGRCAVKYGEAVEVEPCSPLNCPDT